MGFRTSNKGKNHCSKSIWRLLARLEIMLFLRHTHKKRIIIEYFSTIFHGLFYTLRNNSCNSTKNIRHLHALKTSQAHDRALLSRVPTVGRTKNGRLHSYEKQQPGIVTESLKSHKPHLARQYRDLCACWTHSKRHSGAGCTGTGCTDTGCTDTGCTDTVCTDTGCWTTRPLGFLHRRVIGYKRSTIFSKF